MTAVRPIHRESYTPGGNTPLLDAVGRTIMWMDRLQPTPERTLVVILTDGGENASRDFTAQQIRDLIRSREATGTWTSVLYTMAALDVTAALLAILVLKPLRKRMAEGDARTATVSATPSVAV